MSYFRVILILPLLSGLALAHDTSAQDGSSPATPPAHSDTDAHQPSKHELTPREAKSERTNGESNTLTAPGINGNMTRDANGNVHF